MKYLNHFIITTICIMSLSGCGGGSSSPTPTPTPTPTQDIPPVVSSTPPSQYKTTVEQNIEFINDKNQGIKFSLTPSNVITIAANNPSYALSRQDDILLNFSYKIGLDETLNIQYNSLTKKIINLRFKKGETDLSCQDNRAEGCKNTSLNYDEPSGNSTVSFNNQQFDSSIDKRIDTAPYYERIAYKISLNGTIKGTIEKKPFAFSDFEPKHTGQITIDNQVMQINRAYIRGDQLIVQFKNGDTLYLKTAPNSSLNNTLMVGNIPLSSNTIATLTKLDNDRVSVKINNAFFVSNTGTKTVNGEITLINSIANLNIPSIDSNLLTNEAYVSSLNNNEKQYFITFSSDNASKQAISANIITKDESLLRMELNLQGNNSQTPTTYFCELVECKNAAISKDGTYITFNNTSLKSVTAATINVSGKLRTNLR